MGIPSDSHGSPNIIATTKEAMQWDTVETGREAKTEKSSPQASQIEVKANIQDGNSNVLRMIHGDVKWGDYFTEQHAEDFIERRSGIRKKSIAANYYTGRKESRNMLQARPTSRFIGWSKVRRAFKRSSGERPFSADIKNNGSSIGSNSALTEHGFKTNVSDSHGLHIEEDSFTEDEEDYVVANECVKALPDDRPRKGEIMVVTRSFEQNPEAVRRWSTLKNSIGKLQSQNSSVNLDQPKVANERRFGSISYGTGEREGKKMDKEIDEEINVETDDCVKALPDQNVDDTKEVIMVTRSFEYNPNARKNWLQLRSAIKDEKASFADIINNPLKFRSGLRRKSMPPISTSSNISVKKHVAHFRRDGKDSETTLDSCEKEGAESKKKEGCATSNTANRRASRSSVGDAAQQNGWSKTWTAGGLKHRTSYADHDVNTNEAMKADQDDSYEKKIHEACQGMSVDSYKREKNQVGVTYLKSDKDCGYIKQRACKDAFCQTEGEAVFQLMTKNVCPGCGSNIFVDCKMVRERYESSIDDESIVQNSFLNEDKAVKHEEKLLSNSTEADTQFLSANLPGGTKPREGKRDAGYVQEKSDCIDLRKLECESFGKFSEGRFFTGASIDSDSAAVREHECEGEGCNDFLRKHHPPRGQKANQRHAKQHIAAEELIETINSDKQLKACCEKEGCEMEHMKDVCEHPVSKIIETGLKYPSVTKTAWAPPMPVTVKFVRLDKPCTSHAQIVKLSNDQKSEDLVSYV